MISKFRSLINYDSEFFEVISILSPNAWTLVNLMAAMVASVFYFNGDFFAGGILFGLSAIFDLFDGAVAKKTGRETPFGAILDATVDRLGEGLVYAGLTRHVYLAVFALIFSYLVSYVRAKDDRIKIGVAERGERVGLLVVFSLLGAPQIGVYAVLLLAVITVFMRLNKAKQLLR